MTSPEGRRWIVRRLWLPRLRRERQQDGGEEDDDDRGAGEGNGSLGDLFDVDDFGGLVLAAAAVVAIALFVLFLLPYALFVLELLVLAILLTYKILFRRPFTVEALPLGAARERMRWHVVGWRESGDAVREIAKALERGEAQPAPVGATRV